MVVGKSWDMQASVVLGISKNKNLDLIVLNSMNDEGAGFGFETNKVSMISASGKEKEFALKSKREVAKDIVREVKNLL